MGEASERRIVLPYAPRRHQVTLHTVCDDKRFVVGVCHRRFGKTVAAINQLIKRALTCDRERPRYAYIAPTYRQGKAVAWDYLKHFAGPALDGKPNESELWVPLINGAQIRIYGADSPDALRGLYLDGAVLDEYGMMQSNVFSQVVRPALADREGWALFIGTPNGKNQFWDAAESSKSAFDWSFIEFRASQTGVLKESELVAAKQVMTADEYQQEFECSFEASVRGAIYASEISAARESNRITRVAYEPTLKVHTFWDLGVGDATSIWFAQLLGNEVRVIDYYEASGEGLPHYVAMLDKRGYVYGDHWAPHDIQVRELGSGRSRIETAKALGIKFRIAPNIPVEDGIHAAKMLFPRAYFDEHACRAGLECLQNYRRDYNTRLNEFKATPVHDWASHGADAWRYLAVSLKEPKREQPKVSVEFADGAGAWMA